MVETPAPPESGEAERLAARLRSGQATVAVIGLGYVGLPLACEFAGAGLAVHGIDTDEGRVRRVRDGESYVQDVPGETVRRLTRDGKLRSSTDFSVLSRADAAVICVPTPLRKTRDPDISCIVSAVDQIARHLHPGLLVVLESTTYPGTTEEVILPKLESTGLKVGRDFFLAFSPERMDPGNARFNTRNTPKILGGVTPACGRVARALYEQAIDRVIPVSSTRAAEMVKLLENTFRSVNIGLVNEVALMCDRLGLDVWEIIDAAATKPFGFMAFYPGPGLGGHCIPIDPHYLSWKLKTLNYYAKFIELASEINGNMPHYVVGKAVDALNEQEKSVRGARILILGVAYKKDVGDVRESPAMDVIKLLADRGADIRYSDPYAPEIVMDEGARHRSTPLDEKALREADLVIIVTDHSCYDYDFIVRHARSVLDTRNATRAVRSGREKIRRL
ncbi:MAG: nucleotide sugar dehydrogenase [Acidobacteria bacterium]|nr:nucleotide sugar dehydrogenase [Acidobacteriota bacterium]